LSRLGLEPRFKRKKNNIRKKREMTNPSPSRERSQLCTTKKEFIETRCHSSKLNPLVGPLKRGDHQRRKRNMKKRSLAQRDLRKKRGNRGGGI